MTSTADPFGGSYYIEELTDKIEAGAQEYIDRIDALGGTLTAIENNYIQSEIQNAAYAYQQEIERGERIIVGVNRFRQESGQPNRTFRLDPALERQQIERLREVRATRDAQAAALALDHLERTARDGGNLLPAVLACCEAYSSVGEISGRLKSVFGEYQER